MSQHRPAGVDLEITVKSVISSDFTANAFHPDIDSAAYAAMDDVIKTWITLPLFLSTGF